jgi:aspartyl-tRNA(Asn)/glutamyl-tRNA(Gln) amidotransferase subunit A
MESDFETLDAVEIGRLVRARKVAATEVVEACLRRIQDRDHDLNAFVTLDPEGARAAAEVIDRRVAAGEDPGALSGAPVGVKDLLFTADLRTTFGSVHYRDFIPKEDDIAVARLRAAGAIILGKTNTSEFGYGPVPRNALFPATRNPWNPSLSPAGSSAGSAAAVAAGLAPLALGSDGGGSIRVPAALTGVVGFKPSFGRIPVYPGSRVADMPGVSSWESLEHIGPIARSVADVASAFWALIGPDLRDRHSLPMESQTSAARDVWRVAFSPDLGFAVVDPEVSELCERAARILAEALGAPFRSAWPRTGDLQSSFEAIVALDTDIAGLRSLREATGIGFDPTLTRLLDRQWKASDFESAILARKRIQQHMAEFMADWDLLATPSTAVAAFPIDWDVPPTIACHQASPPDFAPFSALANLTGQPAISLPAGLTGDGRPVGLQLLAPRLADSALLQAAAIFERAMPFPRLVDKRPCAREVLDAPK